MTSSVFPGALDSFVDPNPTSKCNATNTTGPVVLHSNAHTLINDAMAAVQAKVGTDGSTDHNSLDYKVAANIAAILALQGTSLLYGSGSPASGTGVDGNFYLDETAHMLYGPKASGAWPAGTSLIGPTGATGPAGATGATGPTGADGATGADGVVQSIVAGTNVTVDSTDPAHPVINASGGGGGSGADPIFRISYAGGGL